MVCLVACAVRLHKEELYSFSFLVFNLHSVTAHEREEDVSWFVHYQMASDKVYQVGGDESDDELIRLEQQRPVLCHLNFLYFPVKSR